MTDLEPGDRVIAIRDSKDNLRGKPRFKVGDVGTVIVRDRAHHRVLFDGQPEAVTAAMSGSDPAVRKLDVEPKPFELVRPIEVQAADAAAFWVEMFTAVEDARRLRKCVMHAAAFVRDRTNVTAADVAALVDGGYHVDAVVVWYPPKRAPFSEHEGPELPLCAPCASDAIRAALMGRSMVPGRVVWLKPKAQG